MKAFLFGGQNNGTTIEIENYLQDINMPIEMSHVSYSDSNQRPFCGVYRVERYKKYNERFKKVLNNSGVCVEMEDLGIFIHDSFTDDEIESLSKIILMVIRAQWKPVRPMM